MKQCFFALLFLTLTFKGNAQDQIVLINQDTLNVKVVKVGSKTITFLYAGESVENEFAFKFVNSAKLGSGRTIKTREELILPFTKDKKSGKIAAINYSEEAEQEADAIFTEAIKQKLSFKMSYKFANDPYGDGTSLMIDLLENDEKSFYDDLNFCGYATGAFMVLTDIVDGISGNYANCTFYSMPVDVDLIKKYLPNKIFKLINSEAKSVMTNAIDNSLKEFILKFRDNGTCDYVNSKTNESLSYLIDKNGFITYTNPAKKKNNSTTYQIVFFDGRLMRYTAFYDNDFITRSIELVD